MAGLKSFSGLLPWMAAATAATNPAQAAKRSARPILKDLSRAMAAAMEVDGRLMMRPKASFPQAKLPRVGLAGAAPAPRASAHPEGGGASAASGPAGRSGVAGAAVGSGGVVIWGRAARGHVHSRWLSDGKGGAHKDMGPGSRATTMTGARCRPRAASFLPALAQIP